MEYLLDTHIFLWWDRDPRRLPRGFDALLADKSNQFALSAISVFELALKRAAGKMKFTGTIQEVVEHHGFRLLAVTAAHCEEAAALPMHHRDPFDRLLIAQARIEKLVVATDDAAIRRYSVPVF